MDRTILKPIECPLKKEIADNRGAGCVHCEYYTSCIWFRIYQKVSYIEDDRYRVQR